MSCGSISINPNYSALDQKNLKKCEEIAQNLELPLNKGLILINITNQTLHLLDPEKNHLASYFISSAKEGTGQYEGSYQTPLGLHQIKEKIGAGSSPFEIFENREKTGKIAFATDEKAHIVARILWLGGLEEGYNCGYNKGHEIRLVDSYQRYIYIHGTNRIQEIGQPASRGCIRMNPDDIISLFELVKVHMPVYIYS